MSSILCEGGTSFCTELIPKELWQVVFMFSSAFTALLLFFFYYRRHLCTQFLMLFHLTEVVSGNLSANATVFGGYVHHWLTNYGRTDRSGWPCFNFSISNGFSQNINFPTCIIDCDSHSQRWIYFYRLTQIFFLQWLFLYCEILIMLWPQCQLTFLQIQRGFFYVFYDITYAFRVKLHSNCLNVKKLLARNSRDIWIWQQDSDPQPLSS